MRLRVPATGSSRAESDALVAAHIDDRTARDAGVHRGLRDRERHRRDEARIERDRDDVVAPEARARALIGGGHLVRHVLAGEVGEGLRGRDLHLHVDRGRLHVQRPAEDVREAEHVVDLVRIVRSSGRDDHVVADAGHVLGRDLRIGIRHREDDGLVRHRTDHVVREGALHGEAEDGVRPLQRFRQRPRGGLGSVGRFPLVHALGAAAEDDALGVAEDHVVGREAHGLQELRAGDAGGPGAVHHEAGLGHVAAGEVEGVDEAGRRDDGGAVLVVMEHRDVHELAQALLDDEAFRRLDVLEVDAPEGRPEIAHGIDERVRVFGVDFEVDGIDVGEALEEDGLSFHHGLRGERSEIAETQDRGAVRDHRHHVGAGGQIEGAGGIFGDRLHRHRNARRIGEREVPLRRHRLRGHHLELAGAPLRVELEGLLVGEGGTDAAAGALIVHR